MDDDAVSRLSLRVKERAQPVTISVRKVPGAQKGITEGQARGDTVFAHEREHLFGFVLSKADAPAAPYAVSGRAVYRADIAEVVEILPVLPKQREKNAVQLIKLKQTGEMVVCDAVLLFHILIYTAHGRARRRQGRAQAPAPSRQANGRSGISSGGKA